MDRLIATFLLKQSKYCYSKWLLLILSPLTIINAKGICLVRVCFKCNYTLQANFTLLIIIQHLHWTLDKKPFWCMDLVIIVSTLWCFLSWGTLPAPSSALHLLLPPLFSPSQPPPPPPPSPRTVATIPQCGFWHSYRSWQIMRAWAWIKPIQIKIITARVTTVANTNLLLTTSPEQFHLILK